MSLGAHRAALDALGEAEPLGWEASPALVFLAALVGAGEVAGVLVSVGDAAGDGLALRFGAGLPYAGP